MLTAAVLPQNWRSLPTWTLIDKRRELRIASKECDERNDLATAAKMYRALASLDAYLAPLLSRPPTYEEWAEASEEAFRASILREDDARRAA